MNYKDIIESKYNRQNWQLLLHDIFGNKVKFWNTPSAVPTSSQFAKQALWLGTITLSDDQTISVYEVELSDSVDIERNRRGIRDMLLSSWRNNGNAGAFMFCYRKNESVLRFSYVSESWKFADDGSYQKESTDAKRFTYLLGEGHRSRTAIQQFEKLKTSALSLKDLTKAFSVDAVSDMFFDGYKKQYEDIIFFVTGKRMVKVANKWEERQEGEPNAFIMQQFARFDNPEKAVRDYVKKLMGRLVFLQFLQKKGWLGVPVNKEWGKGDSEFIQNLFAQTKDKDHFVDNVLESLFDDLNSENEKKLSQYRTPYLNGGLFERDATDETEFPLPAKYMQSMLDFFASYNFTIDENDPDDAEVGVDPEMLGRIFENLLEDNKDKGAFYTPKEIVSYMCRESLIAYLQTDIEDEATKEAIRQFVTTHDINALGTNDKFRQQVDEALKNVKICDPAIGSGAFPMGLLKELFQCRTALEGFGQHQAAEIKKHIIQQNIYGVDIERGAVDIARLRFWLSLIVDEETPQALPNLDFKIMQGNSLLEQYKGVDLSTTTEKKADESGMLSIFDSMLDVYRLDLRKMLAKYYDCTDHHEKLSLRKEIVENVKKQLKEQGINVDFGDLDLSGNNQFMLWHTWFYDVFSQGGFDIVIGNPPYIQLQSDKGFLANIYAGCGYETYSRGGDIYCLFYEQGNRIIRNKGNLCYITSNKWMRAAYGEELRHYFTTRTNPRLLVDFGETHVFDSATVMTNILLFQKSANSMYLISVQLGDDFKTPSQLSSYVEINKVVCQFRDSETWVIASDDILKLKKKVEAKGTPLKEWNISINYGIKTGFDKAFWIDSNKREQILSWCLSESEKIETSKILRPLLRGKDIQKYGCEWKDLWLISLFPSRKLNIDDYPAIKKHLLSFSVERLEQTGTKRIINGLEVKSRKKTSGKWFELQDSISYWKDFDKPKIVYPETTKFMPFYLDERKFLANKTCFIMVGEHISFLTAFFNSSLFKYCFRDNFGALFGGARGMSKIFFDKIPVLEIDDNTEAEFRKLVLDIQQEYSDEKAKAIDQRIFDLYGLTQHEKNLIGYIDFHNDVEDCKDVES